MLCILPWLLFHISYLNVNGSALDSFDKAPLNGYWTNLICREQIQPGESLTLEQCAQKCLDFAGECGGFEVYVPPGGCWIFTRAFDDLTVSNCGPFILNPSCETYDRITMEGDLRLTGSNTTLNPSVPPTINPSVAPTMTPTISSVAPTINPSVAPTTDPSAVPTRPTIFVYLTKDPSVTPAPEPSDSEAAVDEETTSHTEDEEDHESMEGHDVRMDSVTIVVSVSAAVVIGALIGVVRLLQEKGKHQSGRKYDSNEQVW
eukprot:723666_1